MASFVPILILLFMIPFCKSDDQLTRSKPLTHGDTLISKSGYFALGFFYPTSSSKNLYLGIWYNSLPGPRTVVWIANRDNPITVPSSAMLTITNSSRMLLSGGSNSGAALWVAKSDITGAEGTGAYAVLLDSGNFVLRSPDGADTWQSFDHPTDTLLPTMKFLQVYQGRAVGRLVAWKGPDDPSSGDFSVSGDPGSPALQRFIWHGIQPYCRGNVLNVMSVSGGTYANSNPGSIVYETAANQGEEFYIMFTVSDGLPFTRATLEYTGNTRFLAWNNHSSSWAIMYETPAAACDIYASCGPFSYCDLRGIAPTCLCLDGFEPDGLNFSRGCRRREELECKQSHFITLPDMKLPDKFLHIKNRSFQECVAECSRNCSCVAYAYADLSNAGFKADPSRCLVWTGELIDMATSRGSGENMYLRLANSSGSKYMILLKIVLPIIASLLILTIAALIIIFKYRATKRRKRDMEKRQMLEYLNSSNETAEENIEFPFISFEDITTATDNFSDSNQIGRGGFGKVYKGTLKGGKEVAIKRLSEGSRQGIEEFKNEIVLFAKLQHRNLVRLLGCSIHDDERVLIYEYLPNKSLDALLFDASGKHVLDWSIRFKIIKGVARGLLYLHQDSRLTIIHRDLKASNVLLDMDMNPKISDFGLARIFGGNQLNGNTTRIVGTYGYMSPEYVIEGSFSVKLDIYSFGILLLEMVSGSKISSSQLAMDFSSLTAYAWGLWKDGKTRDLVDPWIVEGCAVDEVLRCIHVGLLCIQDLPDDRPLMSSVMFMLENDTGALPAPKQPLYFPLRKCEAEEASKKSDNSTNTMSITTLEGR